MNYNPQGPGTPSIAGIRCVDYKVHPVKFTLNDGGIGFQKASIKIESERNHGINTTCTFYGNFF